MRAAGFTLFETLVALILTGVVALLAYGTATIGFDTRDQLARYRANVEAQMIVRTLLVDALRHPPEGGGAAMNEALFVLVDRIAPDGTPADEVSFLSRGIVPPLGVSAAWTVTLEPGEEGLLIQAVPSANVASPPVVALLPGVRGLNVRVLDRTFDTVWRETWDVTGRVPAAVALELFAAGGAPAGPPMVVHAALDVVR